MKSVKKLIETIILVVIIVVALLLLGFKLFGERIIKTGIEAAGTDALGVAVDVDSLDLSVFKGQVAIKGLDVRNPAGYEQKYLLQMGKGRVQTSLSSLMGNPVEINSIVLDDITLAIEQKGLDNNLKVVLDSIPKSEAEPKEPAAEAKKLVVKDLKITNATVKVKLLPAQILPDQADTVTIKLRPIEMKDLGSGEKLTTAKLASEVMAVIADAVAKEGAGVLPKDVIGSVQDALQNLGDITKILSKQGLKSLEPAKEEAEKMLEKGQESGKEIIEGVKDIFKKKEEQ
jgi:hypothetical protein